MKTSIGTKELEQFLGEIEALEREEADTRLVAAAGQHTWSPLRVERSLSTTGE